MPPDQRAIDVEHVKLKITIQSIRHLPKMDMGFAKCDPFIRVKFFEQSFQTATHKLTYDAFFDESFEIFVHEQNVKSALTAERDLAAAAGLAVQFSCMDFDLFGYPSSGKSWSVLTFLPIHKEMCAQMLK